MNNILQKGVSNISFLYIKKELLTTCQKVLHKQLMSIQTLGETTVFVSEVVQYSKSRIEHELAWISTLMKKI
ncbi:hypothetical protein [Bacillus sp. DX1.1]|uniref:hypothetical protein n=1 Tax=Bacillus sp. DX1.1 TaxID=3055866 RepID=UPI0025A2E9E9|nr:hypothetical protein [Bacillus sp. DX1.1]